MFVLLVKSTLSLLQKQTQLNWLLEIIFTSIHFKSALYTQTFWIPKEPEESSESETSLTSAVAHGWWPAGCRSLDDSHAVSQSALQHFWSTLLSYIDGNNLFFFAFLNFGLLLFPFKEMSPWVMCYINFVLNIRRS